MTVNILFLSYDGMTDPLGQSQVLPYLKGLSALGYNIHLVSFEKEERFSKGKDLIESICKEANISWHPQSYTKKPPVLSTVKDVRKMWQVAAKLHQKTGFHIIHCRSYIAALIGLKMKRRLGTKLIFDMRGFWADERVDGGLWNLKNPLYKTVYRYFKKKEIEFLQEADYTISLTHNAAGEIHSWQKIENNPVPVQVIPCCVDLGLFDAGKLDKEEVATKRRLLGIGEDQTVLSYIGSIGTWYMLNEMLDLFRSWLQKEASAVFLFVTPDAKEGIIAKVREKGIPDDKILVVSAKRAEMPLYIAASDYQVFFIKPVFSKKASSPTKQGEIMAMGKPVICNTNVGDTDYVVNKYGSGILVEDFTGDEYERAIEQAKSGSFDPVKVRHGAMEFFSLEEGVRRYGEVYEKVLVGFKK